MSEDKVIIPDGRDLQISRIVDAPDRSWPETSQIELWEPYSDPFRIPKWANQEKYEYAWLDPEDRHRPLDVALEDGHWAIVKRVNHPGAPTEAFRAHGAVERARQILVFRPRDLGNRLRELPALRHQEIAASRKEGIKTRHYEITVTEGPEAEGAESGKVFAYEEAGSARSSEEAKESLIVSK